VKRKTEDKLDFDEKNKKEKEKERVADWLSVIGSALLDILVFQLSLKVNPFLSSISYGYIS